MRLSTLFSINAIIALLFGLGFLLIPATVVSWYGVTLGDTGVFVARLFGASLLAFALISWQVRNSAASVEVSAILLAFFISDLIGFVVSLIFQLQGLANALGWSTVAIYLLLALGFGYFYWRR